MRTPAILTLLALIAGSASGVRAQSLADAARKEEDRRKTVKASAKVYTNKDLKGVPPPDQPAADATTPLPADTAQGSAPADPVPAPAVSSIGRAGSKAGEKADAKADGKDDSRGEAFWRGRMRGLQEQLEREKTLVEALQSRVNALTTDFVNRDDPGQRAAISADRQKALAELDRTQKAVAADTKAIAALDEEARRAGVPPGWLR